jgi:hypothetical protein
LCIHDLTPATCGVCTPSSWVPALELVAYGPWRVADFEGVCTGCAYVFTFSDVVRSDGFDVWLCWVCGNNDSNVEGN